MMAKKPGPPIPPRPNAAATSNSKKPRSDSPTTSKSSSTATSFSSSTSTLTSAVVGSAAVQPTSAKVATVNVPSESESDSGRTVIYKSPSFDLKKRKKRPNSPNSANCQYENSNVSHSVKSKSQVDIDSDSQIDPIDLKQQQQQQMKLASTSNECENIIYVSSSSDQRGRNVSKSIVDVNQSTNATSINCGRTSGNSVISNRHNKRMAPIPKPRISVPNHNNTKTSITQSQSTLSTTVIESSSHVASYVNDVVGIKEVNQVKMQNGNNYGAVGRIDPIAPTSQSIEIENNLKNVAERLLTEITVNQSQPATVTTTTSSCGAPVTKFDSTVDQQQSKQQYNVSKTKHCILVKTSANQPITATTFSTAALSSLNSFDNPIKPSNRACINLNGHSQPDEVEIGNKTLLVGTGKSEISGVSIRMDPEVTNGNNIVEKKVAFHEMLISELTAMRKNSNEMLNIIDNSEEDDDNHSKSSDKIMGDDDCPLYYPKLSNKRYTSAGCSTDSSPYGTHSSRVHFADWTDDVVDDKHHKMKKTSNSYSNGGNGSSSNKKKVTLISCHGNLEDSGLEDEERLDDTSSGFEDSWDSIRDVHERMSLPGLPPLPKSLSGLESSGNIPSMDSQRVIVPINRISAPLAGSPTTTTLDTQLAILRREMFGLRQLDLSLLSQLWALNESIQEFRTMLQEQETLSPPSPSPTPSETNSLSSADEDNISTITKSQQMTPAMQRMRAAPPPPPPLRKDAQRPV